VNLLGVSIGRVTEIQVQPRNQDFITVRFALTSDTILHRGVTASIERSLFDGSAKLSLSGDNNRDPVLAAREGQPFPIVPAKGGGLSPRPRAKLLKQAMRTYTETGKDPVRGQSDEYAAAWTLRF